MQIKLSREVKELIGILNKNNFEAFVVGGCVRDSLLNTEPHDWDICTNATPDEIMRCFSDYTIFDAGKKHGTISVVKNKSVYEITTYRIDGEYTDNRHPDSVVFTKNIELDLSRRDFTVNAMAYNEKVGLVDPFNGRADLENRIIRCVGEPDKRFNEDALRIIRALRFSSTYGFTIEQTTADSIIGNAELLKNIAVERIAVELNRLLCGKNVEAILENFKAVFAVFIPEIIPMFDYDQCTEHHNRDLWRHTIFSVKSIEPDPALRMTMLLHDLGKPLSCTKDENGKSHFKGHPAISERLSVKILKRLKYPTEFIKKCALLIKFHDVRFIGSKRQVRHLLNRIGEENFILLLKVQRADIMAQSMYEREEKLSSVERGKAYFDEIIAENECFSLKDLNINGKDLIALGIRGRGIGVILNELLRLVINEEIENQKNKLIEKAFELKFSVD